MSVFVNIVLNFVLCVFLIVNVLGVASHNIGGKTVHSTFGLNVQKGIGKNRHRIAETRSMSDDLVLLLRNLYKDVTHVIIDEISMISPEVFKEIDERCRLIFQSKDPFGGKSVIMFGDFCQLPPVCACPILFSGDIACAALWHLFEKIQLTQNQRQRGDHEFLDLLNSVRFGNLSADDRNLMESRLNAHVREPSQFSDAMHIFTTNDKVDAYNKSAVATIPGKIYTCQAKQGCMSHADGTGMLPERRADCGGLDLTVVLKVRCRVMLLRNQAVEDGLYNGAVGIVHGIFMDEKKRVTQVDVVFDSKDAGRKTGRRIER